MRRPTATDFLCYALYLGTHVVLSPLLALRSLLRARKRSHAGIVWARAFQIPWRRQRVNTVLVGAAMGETRVAWQIAQELASLGDSCAVLAGTFNASKTTGVAGIAPFNSPIAAMVFLAKYRPERIWFVKRCELHHVSFLAWMLGVRCEVVDTMVSEDDFRRMKSWKPWDRWRLRAIQSWAVPDESQSTRLRELGVDSASIVVTGPLLGANVRTIEEALLERKRWRLELGLPADAKVLVGGSTYPPDEHLIVEAMGGSDWCFVLAPRSLSRVGEVEALLQKAAIPIALRSEGRRENVRAVVLDTMGELGSVYAVADAAHIGGGFDAALGGHSPAEAFAWGVPCTIGPCTEQQKALVDSAKTAGALTIVQNASEAHAAWTHWTEQPEDMRTVVLNYAANLGRGICDFAKRNL